MENRRVILESGVDCPLYLEVPNYHFSRVFKAAGQKIPVPYEVAEELVYDIGFKASLAQGKIRVVDKQDRIDLGLEYDEETAEEVHIFTVLEMTKLWTIEPLSKFKEAVQNAPKAQVERLIDFAVAKKYSNYDKAHYIKELTGQDIIQKIQFSE